MDIPAREERESLSSICLFVLFGSLMMLTHMGKSGLSLLLTIQMSISSRKTLTDTPKYYVFSAIWASLSPAELTHKMNHHIVHI